MALQDMNVLHQQERKLAKKQRGWRDYYLATQSDTGVALFWRWLDTFGGAPELLAPCDNLGRSCLWPIALHDAAAETN